MFASSMLPLLVLVSAAPQDKPSMERHAAGTFVSKDQMLLAREGGNWKRLTPNARVHTADTLLSLPGYKSEIKLDSKADLLLWGSLPELFPMPILESCVTLHATGKSGLDADLTLHRGRIYLTNRKEKGPASVRLRFASEVWDVTLDAPDTALGFEVYSLYTPEQKGREGGEPLRQAALYVLKGSAQLKAGLRTFGDLRGPVGRALVEWTNTGRGLTGPHAIEKKIGEWDVEQPLPEKPADEPAKKVRAALGELAKALGKSVETGLIESLEDRSSACRVLAVRALGAIDSVGPLLDVLAKDGPAAVRREALFALRHWLSRGPEQAAKLYDAKMKSGLLLDKKYSANEARTITDLLYAIPQEERRQKEIYEVLIRYLGDGKPLVRTLAHWHLSFLAPGVKIAYNPSGSREERERGVKEWKKLLDTDKLPPPEK